jgi:signal transduction histidine kinase/DNA-binding NarL/FixJ family response regulator
MLFNQIIYFISKPKDNVRLRFAILIALYIGFNLISGYFPDKRINISYNLQVQIAYSFPILMSYYMAYYIYKLLDFEKFHWLLLKAPIYTLLIPYFILFLLPYLITKNEQLSSYLIAIVPGSYAVFAVFRINLGIRKNFEYLKKKVNHLYLKLLSANLGIISLITLAMAQYSLNAVVEVVLVNSGLIIISIIFLVIHISDSQNDYNKLVQSENKLQEYSEQLEQKVIQRTKDLELANEQRTHTFVNLAHETRTPLTLIKNNIDELKKNNKNLKKNKELESIRQNCERLNAQITNILNVEKSIKGYNLYNHNAVLNLSEYTESIICSFKPYSLKKNIKIEASVQNGIYIKSAPEAIHSIINNLIENAIKYTDVEGKININLSLSESKIKFTVKDTGFGIPEDYQKKIFEPYVHIPVNGNNNHGVGVGLSLVRTIVEDMNGKVKLNSTVNEGSEFTVLLPRYFPGNDEQIATFPEQDINASQESIDDLVSDPKFPNILVIEDNKELLRYMRDQLSELYNIYVAENGHYALQKLNSLHTKIDLIISDVMMDGMDGIKFFQHLKELGKDYIPLIYVTAKTNSHDRDNVLEMGAIDYIYKPFEINEVKSKVFSIIQNTEKQRSIAFSTIQNMIDSQKKQLSRNQVNSYETFDSNCKIYNITNREKDIIKYARKGKTYKEIASLLFISSKTVDTHLQRIYKKVGVGNKQELFEKLY